MRARLAKWFGGDAAGRTVMRQGVLVSSGKAFGQVTSLVTVALLTRQLGPQLFGVLALIRTVAAVIEAYANCNTWQAVIKFGSDAIAQDRPQDVKRIIKLAALVDVSTAVSATIVIAGVAFVVPSAFGWTFHESALCALYSLTVLTSVVGTTDGIFRVCRQFRSQAITYSLQSLVPMITVSAAVLLDAGLDGVVIALTLGESLGNMVPIVVASWVASRQGYGGWWRVPLKGVRTTFPGVVHFMIATNGYLTVRKTQAELDMIIVGSMLGQVASGLFKLVKQVGKMPSFLFLPFEQVLFTELSRFAAKHDYDRFARTLRWFTLVAGGGGLVIWAVASLIAGPLVHVIAGAKFMAAVPALRIYLLAIVVTIACTPTQRALVALGRPGILLAFETATLLVQIGTMIAGAVLFGIVGVAGAMLLHKLTQLTWSTLLVAHVLKQRRSLATDLQTAPAPP